MYGKKYPIIIIVISSLILSLSITSCNQNRDNEHEMAPAVPFMFHVFDPGHGETLGDDFAKELKDELNENMVWTAPPYFWADIEPSDNQFNWDELDDFVDSHRDKYRVINMGPEFMSDDEGNIFIGGDVPDWIENRYSNAQLKEQYGELVREIVSRYKNDIDMWWIGLEVNLGGDGLSWETWKSWLRWQTGLIRECDPDGKIAISFGSWTAYHEKEIPPNAIHEIDGAEELINEGVDFDIIAIEYHYGTLQKGNINNLRQSLVDLASVGKEIFIWEVFYPGGTDSSCQDNWDWEYPPEGGYTEEWQAEQLYETVKMAYEIPQVVGINILHFQEITYSDIGPDDWEAGWRCYAGLVGADGTPKEAYFRLKNYWNEISGR
jgi:hypothetical protein